MDIAAKHIFEMENSETLKKAKIYEKCIKQGVQIGLKYPEMSCKLGHDILVFSQITHFATMT